MSGPADCCLCGRICPNGGVLDHVGRPAHYLCLGLAKRELAEQARITAKRVAREGRPATNHPALPVGDAA